MEGFKSDHTGKIAAAWQAGYLADLCEIGITLTFDPDPFCSVSDQTLKERMAQSLTISSATSDFVLNAWTRSVRRIQNGRQHSQFSKASILSASRS